MIKYVVTVGQRYSTYSLVDMRVHDINVVADLTRHDPTAPDPEEPIGYDGSTEGALGDPENLGPSSQIRRDLLLDQMASIVFSWMSQLWPRLLGAYEAFTEYGGHMVLQISVDLLGDTRVESAFFDTPWDDGLSQSQKEALQVEEGDALLLDLGGPFGVYLTLLTLAWIAIDTSLSLGVLTLGVATAVLVTAWVLFWFLWLPLIWSSVDTGALTLLEARALTAGFAVALMGETVVQALIVLAAVHKLMAAAKNLTKIQALAKLGGWWIPISLVIKFIIGAVTWYCRCLFYERSLMALQ
ncbi:MAG: hypothetical protein C4K49_07655 [Candidatus Thorarchaeota archaeon]|nr:MAG: hypothetical protein C4K49_07655 [Candidatus Thorarchaeota archaeon]